MQHATPWHRPQQRPGFALHSQALVYGQPAQSLQRRQTARRIGVYVSFQSFTNTLVIWPFLATRGISSYKMCCFLLLKICILDVYYLSIHNIFIWSKGRLLSYEGMCFLYVAALLLWQWWTHLSCAPLVYKSLLLLAHQKHFFSPLVQWYIHAGSLYLEVGSVILLALTTMQSETSFVITLKKLHFTEIYLWFVTSELQFREMTLCFKMLCCICSRLKVKGWWPNLVSLICWCWNFFSLESLGRSSAVACSVLWEGHTIFWKL